MERDGKATWGLSEIKTTVPVFTTLYSFKTNAPKYISVVNFTVIEIIHYEYNQHNSTVMLNLKNYMHTTIYSEIFLVQLPVY